jgi:SAM-dependent methyltransferase
VGAAVAPFARDVARGDSTTPGVDDPDGRGGDPGWAERLARAQGAAAGAANVRFVNADAQTHRLDADSADVVFSRFGVMFFADPAAAFANLRQALTARGRLAFVCWRSFPENPWMAVPMMAAIQHVTLPPPPPPDAPGPFAFADADRVHAILTGAGFTDVGVNAVDETLTVGGTTDLDRAVRFLLDLGPTARVLREADPAVLPAVTAAIREALRPYHGPEGVRMTGAAWIATARRG